MGCYNSIVINAPIEKVWSTIKDFHDMGWAKGVIETLDVVGDKKGTQVGAKRVLNGAFHETLLTLDTDRRCFTYSIDDGPGAVSKDAVKKYVGEVQLHSITDTNKTFFMWRSTFESKDSKAVLELCNPIYQGILMAARDNIK